MSKSNIARGLKYGIIAGLVSTMVSDIVSLIIFRVMGESFSSFFALIGQSFLTLFHSDIANPVWQGLTLHYSIGILTGLVLGLATQYFRILKFSSYKRSILISIIITQVEGNALFYLMSVIMHIPQSDMVMMYGLGFILHLIWGTCLGTIIRYGQKRSNTIESRWSHSVKQPAEKRVKNS
jgi:hypothetical protein